MPRVSQQAVEMIADLVEPRVRPSNLFAKDDLDRIVREEAREVGYTGINKGSPTIDRVLEVIGNR